MVFSQIEEGEKKQNTISRRKIGVPNISLPVTLGYRSCLTVGGIKFMGLFSVCIGMKVPVFYASFSKGLGDKKRLGFSKRLPSCLNKAAHFLWQVALYQFV